MQRCLEIIPARAGNSETANCRCTLVACCDGLDVLDGERFSRIPESMTYEVWKAGESAVNGAKPANKAMSRSEQNELRSVALLRRKPTESEARRAGIEAGERGSV